MHALLRETLAFDVDVLCLPLPVDEVFLGVRPYLLGRARANEVLNSVPVFAVQLHGAEEGFVLFMGPAAKAWRNTGLFA